MLILAKYAEIMLQLFPSKITMQQTSKLLARLPYLRLETRVHNLFSGAMKSQTKSHLG